MDAFERLSELIEDLWGEDEEDAKAFARIIFAHVAPSERETVVTDDLIFNRYNGITSYGELAEEILADDWDCCDMENYLSQLQSAIDNNTTETFLKEDGWHIDTEYGGALGLDEEVILA